MIFLQRRLDPAEKPDKNSPGLNNAGNPRRTHSRYYVVKISQIKSDRLSEQLIFRILNKI